jgi:hypothetical protein
VNYILVCQMFGGGIEIYKPHEFTEIRSDPKAGFNLTESNGTVRAFQSILRIEGTIVSLDWANRNDSMLFPRSL